MTLSGSDVDPINGRMEAVHRALMTDRAGAERHGVSVEVSADGTLESLRIAESVTPYGKELAALIVQLAKEALVESRQNVRDRMAELKADPRIEDVLESISRAADKKMPSSQVERVRAAHPDDDLTEDELIEMNERRNQSYFR
ncbi:YbaB/EbfC family nucleoid-associated protein [Nocardia sp. NPDC057272]|uniref:YbaB/EbfC family nucleoid-associated protein n=1 Tax=Nocardia sp. NPDC057272 TaxID=3346079 RepID=UPI003632DF70